MKYNIFDLFRMSGDCAGDYMMWTLTIYYHIQAADKNVYYTAGV